MSKKNPDEEPKIQMTPVEFSPTDKENALGNVGGFLPLHEMSFPLSVPVAIMLLTLIFSTVRDIATFNRSITEISQLDAPGEEMLKREGKQTEFVNSMRTGLEKIAPTDPTAAQILREFFPQDKISQAPAASTPATPPAK